ncbi:extracellular solute-binding protein [bacterium]|nr:extracellular solute-binding protein [bacterium]
MLRDSGYFKPLFDALNGRTGINDLEFNFDDFIPAIGNYYSVDGQFYSMPWNTSAPILYANMNLLVEAGIAENLEDMDAMAGTWTEIEEHCQIILEALDDVACSYWRIDTWYLENSMAMAREYLINNENGRAGRADEVILTSDAAIQLFEWWRRMLDEGYFIQYGANPGTAPASDFATGRVVYYAAASSASIRTLNNALAENNYIMGTNSLPYNPEWDYGSIGMGGATIYISDGLAPEVEEAALTFLAFNVLPENDAAYHLEFGYVPVRPSTREILEADGWPLVFQAPVRQFDAANLTNAVGPLLPTFLETRVIINEAMTAILLDGAPILETLQEAEADATSLLQEYNLLVE